MNILTKFKKFVMALSVAVVAMMKAMFLIPVDVEIFTITGCFIGNGLQRQIHLDFCLWVFSDAFEEFLQECF